MGLPRTEVEKALQAKGFLPSGRKGEDHRYYIYHSLDNKKTRISTHVSTGGKYADLGNDLVKKMARQCQLTTAEFKAFIECTLSQAAFETLVKTRTTL